MDNKDQAMQKAMQVAQSLQGQQLIHLLQKGHPDIVQQAMKQASQGNYAQVEKLLSTLLSDPEAQKLLNQLGR
jgi:putative lipoic acid-binding regulatory protein